MTKYYQASLYPDTVDSKYTRDRAQAFIDAAREAGLTIEETRYGGFYIRGAKSAAKLTKLAGRLDNTNQILGMGHYHIEVDKDYQAQQEALDSLAAPYVPTQADPLPANPETDPHAFTMEALDQLANIEGIAVFTGNAGTWTQVKPTTLDLVPGIQIDEDGYPFIHAVEGDDWNTGLFVRQCIKCRQQDPLRFEGETRNCKIQQEDGATFCDFCPQACYVTVYLVDMARGGSEEGGWYYEYGEPQPDPRNSVHSNAYQAMKAKLELETDLDANDNKGRRPISSVCSQGEYRAIIDRNCFPASYPTRTPRYE